MLYTELRPHNFDSMVGQEKTVKAIAAQSMRDSFFSLYILGGQYGSGKTTMARIIALAANCGNKDENGNPCLECGTCRAVLSGNAADYMEVDAASRTGVENIRTIIEDSTYMPTSLKKKIYIIDEVHMLSRGAFNSFLKTLEEPPEYCIFILCTTDVNAIPATVISRAACYQFGRIAEEDIVKRLEEACRKKGFHIGKNVLHVIAQNSDGAMRNALSLLEQTLTLEAVTDEAVRDMMGVADSTGILRLLHAIIDNEMAASMKMVEEFACKGRILSILAGDMLKIICDAIKLKAGGELINTDSYVSGVESLCKKTTISQLCSISEELLQLKHDLRGSESVSLAVCTVAKACGLLAERDETSLLVRIEKLEAAVSGLSAQIAGKQDGANRDMADTNKVFMEEIPEGIPFRETVPEGDLSGKKYPELDPPVSDPKGQFNDATEGENRPEQETAEEEACTGMPEEETASESVDDWFEAFDIFGCMAESLIPGHVETGTVKYGEVPATETTIMSEDKEKGRPSQDIYDITDSGYAVLEEEVMTEKQRTVLGQVESIMKQEPAIFSAIEEGTKRVCRQDGWITYITPLQPVASLLNTYFEAYQVEAACIFDQAIEI